MLRKLQPSIPAIDAHEDIKVAIGIDDIQTGDTKDPGQHPLAIALRRTRGIDGARVIDKEMFIRRDKKRFRYGAIDKQFVQGIAKDIDGVSNRSDVVVPATRTLKSRLVIEFLLPSSQMFCSCNCSAMARNEITHKIPGREANAPRDK